MKLPMNALAAPGDERWTRGRTRWPRHDAARLHGQADKRRWQVHQEREEGATVLKKIGAGRKTGPFRAFCYKAKLG